MDIRTEIARPPRTDMPAQPKPDMPKPTRQDVSRPRTDSPGIARPEQSNATVTNEPPRAVGRVNVTALAILATNSDNRVDPALRNLAEQLKPTFRFSGYRLAQTDARVVAIGQPAGLRLIGPYSLQVIPMQAEPGYVLMKVQALQAGRRVLGLQVRLRPGMYQLVGGWPVSGSTLLAGVSARPAE
jgi:hypothetical protein